MDSPGENALMALVSGVTGPPVTGKVLCTSKKSLFVTFWKCITDLRVKAGSYTKVR